MKTQFRHVYSGHCDAVTNMAIDEYLFEQFIQEKTLPVFRIYGWKPAALSLGRSQNARSVNKEKCLQDGIPTVRRMTGGGAIFHDREITYSIICAGTQAASSVKECYRFLCGFLISLYKGFGLNACFARETAHESPFGVRNPVCFAAREEYDLTVNGYKIGGNAQRWKRGIVFQHGSIPFSLTPGEYDTYMTDGKDLLAENASSLESFGVSASFDEITARMKNAFCDACDASFLSEETMTSLPPGGERFREKYASPAWTWEGIYDETAPA